MDHPGFEPRPGFDPEDASDLRRWSVAVFDMEWGGPASWLSEAEMKAVTERPYTGPVFPAESWLQIEDMGATSFPNASMRFDVGSDGPQFVPAPMTRCPCGEYYNEVRLHYMDKVCNKCEVVYEADLLFMLSDDLNVITKAVAQIVVDYVEVTNDGELKDQEVYVVGDIIHDPLSPLYLQSENYVLHAPVHCIYGKPLVPPNEEGADCANIPSKRHRPKKGVDPAE